MTAPLHSILIVEDDPGVRGLMAELVYEAFTIDPVVATTGAEALRLAAEDCPAVMVIDLGLPDMPGDEVARFVQELCDRGTYVLVCSAAGAEAPGRVRAMGAHDFIAKPFDLDRFIAAVQRGLDRRVLG